MSKDWKVVPVESPFSLTDTSNERMLRTIDATYLKFSGELEAFYSRKKSLFMRLFPLKTKLDRVLQDGQLNRAKTECELYERLMQLACSMKLSACEEAASGWVKSVRFETQQQFSDFITERMIALQQTIAQRCDTFCGQMKQRYEMAEKYKDIPVLHSHLKNSIEDEIEQTMKWLTNVIDRLRVIADERIARFEREGQVVS